jgi:hypothetical protein
MSIAPEGHHGHAHPRCLAGGGGAITGKWIKRNIDPIAERKMRGPVRYAGQEFYPLGGYAAFPKTLQE